MAESHWHAADAMYSAKKLMPIIPVGAFQLIMQGLLQPVIKLKGQCVHDALTHHDDLQRGSASMT